MNPTRILVPTDLSKRSERAIDYASDLSDALGAELILVLNVNLPERAVLEPFALSGGSRLPMQLRRPCTAWPAIMRHAPQQQSTSSSMSFWRKESFELLRRRGLMRS